MYFAFSDELKELANSFGLEPLYLLEELWILELIGAIEKPELSVERAKIGKTKLSKNLRFFSDES